MKYKGFFIVAKVKVTQRWAFEEKDGKIDLEHVIPGERANAEDIEGFVIFDGYGNELRAEPHELKDAKTVIDEKSYF